MLSASDVREILKENIVEVVFEKKDGSLRTMFCTLIEEFLPSKGEEIITQSRKLSDEVITCWDLECNDWRSFRLGTVKSLEAEPVE